MRLLFEISFIEWIIISILENGNEEEIEGVKVFYGVVVKSWLDLEDLNCCFVFNWFCDF